MDEILRPAYSESAVSQTLSEKKSSLREKALKAVHAVQAGAVAVGGKLNILRHRADNAMAGRKVIGPLPFLAVAAVAAAAFIVSSVYTPSYVVTVDGVTLGVVEDTAVMETVIDSVEERTAAILGHDYTLEQNVEYSFALSRKNELSAPSYFEPYLFSHVSDVMQAYTLFVNGQFIGAAADQASLEAMLDEISSPYITEDTTSVSFVEDILISYEYVASDVEQNLTNMANTLLAASQGESVYTVVVGDTYSVIAQNHNMTLDELMSLNPQASLNRLYAGDQLVVQREVPFLSVRTTESIQYSEAIPYSTETQYDSTMYEGNTRVIQQGVNGEALVHADLVYINGYEDSRVVTSSETVTEPVTRIVAVGTKPRPATLPTGSFSWPLSGYVSSGYGWRYIFGGLEWHTGIDIVAPAGAPITAADGGTVIHSGWRGSYGNLVIIDHGEGVHSYYAHCSSLLVSPGAQVYKGQQIALVGATGRVTGAHLHFEVRLNNRDVNPLAYLP